MQTGFSKLTKDGNRSYSTFCIIGGDPLYQLNAALILLLWMWYLQGCMDTAVPLMEEDAWYGQRVPPKGKKCADGSTESQNQRALQSIGHLLVAVLLQPDWRWGVHRVLGGLEEFLGNPTFSVSFYYLVLFSSKICVWIHSYPSPWCRRWQQSPHMSKWPMVITLRQVRVCADFAIIGQLVVLQMKGQYIYN